jgi:shikimate kinase
MSSLNIIFCGLPSSGKTSLGALLAKQLQWSFIDTDRLIEALHPEPLSCREIYLKIGEEGFRALEKRAIASLIGSYHSVIATGGGALLDPENRRILKSLGRMIYLQASPQTLLERLKSRKLPATLDSQNLIRSWENLCQQRLPLYEQTCDLTLNTDLHPLEALVTLLTNMLETGS